jgi:hypothetical protein
MASCLTVTASAQQASALSAPPGSTQESPQERPRASERREDTLGPQEFPLSVERIRDGLAREPVLRLDSQPIYRMTVAERRPRYWDLQSPFLFPVEPRTTTTRWHDEFTAMVTDQEAQLYSPMLSQGETATIAATSLLFAAGASLITAGFSEWKQSRREGKARRAVAEVDAALAAWTAANPRP